MIKFFLVTLFTFISLSSTYAYERADAFIVKMFDDRIKVLSPVSFKEQISVIIENKTLTKTLSRLEREGGEVISFISINAKGVETVSVKLKKSESLFLVPISPPFQKVRLISGKGPYEIPPKR